MLNQESKILLRRMGKSGLCPLGNEERNMESKLVWDLLPEEFPYEDKGCELFPSCLNCPFPDCLKEEP